MACEKHQKRAFLGTDKEFCFLRFGNFETLDIVEVLPCIPENGGEHLARHVLLNEQHILGVVVCQVERCELEGAAAGDDQNTVVATELTNVNGALIGAQTHNHIVEPYFQSAQRRYARLFEHNALHRLPRQNIALTLTSFNH